MKLNVYSAKGIKKGTTQLPKGFVSDPNSHLLAQAIRVYEDKMHPGLAKVKTRGEVSASTVKIWRQKGTGRARHGAISAPIFVGGGVAHGPKGLKRKLSLPKKMKSKALKVALSIKAKEGKLIILDNINSLSKTKEVATLIDQITHKQDLKPDSTFTFVLSDKNKKSSIAFRNIKNISLVPFKNLNAHDIFFGGTVIVDKVALIEKSIGGKKSTTSRTSITGRTGRKTMKEKLNKKSTIAKERKKSVKTEKKPV